MLTDRTVVDHRVRFVSLPMGAPDDVSALANLLTQGLRTRDIVAVFIKTEGNGLDNDWSRPLAARALRDLLELPADAEPTVVISGGCEGFTTPHLLLVVRAPSRLLAATAQSRVLANDEIGTKAQIEATAAALIEACRASDVDPATVAYAHVVAPWIDSTVPPGAGPRVADDAHSSKPWTRGASALGAAVALNHLSHTAAAEALVARDLQVHGSRCAVTAGATGGRVRVLVFANCAAVDGTPYAGVHTQHMRCHLMQHPWDLPAGLEKPPTAVLFKGDPPPNGRLSGERIVLLGDSDIHAFRHHRAAMSGVLSASTGTTRIFIGGGAEHQCPPGGGLLVTVSEGDLT
jgi:cyanuric acid amidohydrolase